jgi:hypothetical protein
MTDVLIPPAEVDTQNADQPRGYRPKNCRTCGVSFIPKSGKQIYCDEHGPKKQRAKEDKAPPSIQINLGATPGASKAKGDPEIEQVRARALALAKTLAMFLTLINERDAQAVDKGSENWAKAVAEVARHEEWLRKFAAGGDAPERVMAWLGLGMASAGIILPILLNHNALPPQVAALVVGMVEAGAGAVEAERAAA